MSRLAAQQPEGALAWWGASLWRGAVACMAVTVSVRGLVPRGAASRPRAGPRFLPGAGIGRVRVHGSAHRGRMVNPWKVIAATLIIFVCGLVTGALIVKTTTQNVHPASACGAGASDDAGPRGPSHKLDRDAHQRGLVSHSGAAHGLYQADGVSAETEPGPARAHRPDHQGEPGAQQRALGTDRAADEKRLKRVTDEIRKELDRRKSAGSPSYCAKNRRENHLKAATNLFPAGVESR